MSAKQEHSKSEPEAAFTSLPETRRDDTSLVLNYREPSREICFFIEKVSDTNTNGLIRQYIPKLIHTLRGFRYLFINSSASIDSAGTCRTLSSLCLIILMSTTLVESAGVTGW